MQVCALIWKELRLTGVAVRAVLYWYQQKRNLLASRYHTCTHLLLWNVQLRHDFFGGNLLCFFSSIFFIFSFRSSVRRATAEPNTSSILTTCTAYCWRKISDFFFALIFYFLCLGSSVRRATAEHWYLIPTQLVQHAPHIADGHNGRCQVRRRLLFFEQVSFHVYRYRYRHRHRYICNWGIAARKNRPCTYWPFFLVVLFFRVRRI